jgi:hypothetical protein
MQTSPVQNNNNSVAFSRERTTLLSSLNMIFGRGAGDRSPILSSIVKKESNLNKLLNLDKVSKTKISVIMSIPNELILPICICELADCCALKDCPFCDKMRLLPCVARDISLWKHYNPENTKYCSVIENDVKIDNAALVPVAYTDDGGAIYYDTVLVSSQYQKFNKSCKFGSDCRFQREGTCKFEHPETPKCKFGMTCRNRLHGCRFEHSEVVHQNELNNVQPCKFGQSCRFLSQGTCKFSH